MTEIQRTYALGDRVISRCALVAPPVEPPGVRLEIPKGCDGEVVDVRPYDYHRPYAVKFEVVPGAHVEVDVAESEIALIERTTMQERSEIPPLHVKQPRRHINREALHAPSKRHPHHSCKTQHGIHWALQCAMYGLVLWEYTFPVFVITVLVLLVGYSSHLKQHNRWAWVPSIFLHETPQEGEKLVISENALVKARVADMIYTLEAAILVAQCFAEKLGGAPQSVVMWVVLVGATGTAWLAKFVYHEKAALIMPDYDN